MQRIKFPRHGDFRRTVTSRVNEYFVTTGLDQRGHGAMYLKTATIFAWFLLSYGLLVFAPIPVWAKVLTAISLGIAGAGIGTAVMHDAGHGSYSKHLRLNRVIFFSLDVLGGS
ncbi:MAG: acyl-CoA desaturase, partial [Bradymonadaceae bacterium]